MYLYPAMMYVPGQRNIKTMSLNLNIKINLVNRSKKLFDVDFSLTNESFSDAYIHVMPNIVKLKLSNYRIV